MQQDIWIYIGVFASAVLTGMMIALWRMNSAYDSPRRHFRRRRSRSRSHRSPRIEAQPSNGA